MRSQQSLTIKSSNKTSNVSNSTLALVVIGNLIAHSAEHIFAMSLAPLFVLVLQDIPMTLTQIGLLSTSQVVPNVGLGLVYGILADKYGSKGFIIGGTALSSLGVYLTSRATTYLSLLVAQFLLGIALSAYHPTGLCMVTRVFLKRPKAMGRGLSIQSIGGVGGSGVAPLLMVALAEWYGNWRNALGALALIGLGATLLEVLTLLPIQERIESVREEPLPKVVSKQLKGHRLNSSFITASFILLLIFSFTRSSVFRNTMYFLPIYFESLGYTVFLAGVFTSIFFGFGAVSEVLGGILVDKTASKKMIFIGSSFFSGIACLMLAFVGRGDWTISILVIFGVSFFIGIPSLSVSVSQHAPAKSQGIAFAIYFAVTSLFGAFSSTMFGMIGDRWTLQIGLVFIGLLCFIGSLIGSKIQENPLKQAT